MSTNVKIDKNAVYRRNGEDVVSTPKKDYIKAVMVEFNIPEKIKHEESGREYTGVDVVSQIIDTVKNGMPLNEFFTNHFSPVVTQIENDLKESKAIVLELEKANSKNKDEDAEKKKAEKESKKKAEEEAAKETLRLQAVFADLAVTGSDKAASQFVAELAQLKSSLPEGVEIDGSEGRVGLKFDENVSAESLGETMGFLYQRADSTDFMKTAFQFMIGDAIVAAVARNLYPSAREAAKTISDDLGKRNKSISVSGLQGFARAAARIPSELRNSTKAYRGYHLLASIAPIKKQDGEKDEDFKAREDSYESARKEILSKYADDKEFDSVKLGKEIETMYVRFGIKEDPAGKPAPVSEKGLLLDFFHATVGLEHLVGLNPDAPDDAVYDKGGAKVAVSKQDLIERRERAYAQLKNIIYTGSDKFGKITPGEFFAGVKSVTQLEPNGVDAAGKALTKEVVNQVKVYPNLPFVEDKEPEPAATEPAAETAAPAPEPAPAAPAKGKRGK